MSDTYTHTRISREYLMKLQDLALLHKRSAMKELETLIDEGLKQQGRAILRNAIGEPDRRWPNSR